MDLSVIRNEIAKVAKKIVTVRTGTVVSDRAPLNQTLVRLDNDDSETPVSAQGLNYTLPAGTRVSLLSSPMFGLQILGSLADTGILESEVFPLGTAWVDYVPTLTQSATVAKTVTQATYTRVGRTIHAQMTMSVTGAGTAGQQVRVGLPVASSHQNTVGYGYIYDASTATRYVVSAFTINTSQIVFLNDASGGNIFGAAPAVTLASGDILDINVTYQAGV